MMRYTQWLLLPLGLAWAAVSFASGNVKAGEAASQTCAACHGAGGQSTNAQFPKLAGQHPEYLVKALSDYKTGARKNPIMAGQAAALSRQQMEDLAAYFAAQPSALYVKK